MKKRILAVICIFTAAVLLLCSCRSTPATDAVPAAQTDNGGQEQKIVKITLPYSDSDSLNPFFATDSRNIALAYLYCQPLFELKSDYSVEPVIAADYTVEGRNVFVTLRDTVFSDSTPVSARDVVYSYELAKEAPAFSQRLACIEDAYMKGERVVFTFAEEDKFGVNLLTFPIVKFGSAWSNEVLPIGSGVYIFSGNLTMTVNPNSQAASSINTIELYNVRKLEYVTNELEIGNYNFLFDDLSEGYFKPIVAKTRFITLNNIVYLGFNMNNPLLSSASMRAAVFCAVDKNEVSATAYQGCSKAAVTPFNPDFYILGETELPSGSGDRTRCAEALSKLGYNFTGDSAALSNGERKLEMTVLVNSDNGFRVAAAYKIAEELNGQGFLITVDTVDYETYRQRIEQGDYCMYIGEIKLTENMDLSVFKNTSVLAGVDSQAEFFKQYSSFRRGETGPEKLLESFYDYMPFVPICYRAGIAAYSSVYTPDFTYAPINIYGNMENWEASKQQ